MLLMLYPLQTIPGAAGTRDRVSFGRLEPSFFVLSLSAAILPHIPNERLAAFIDVYMLDPDNLRATVPQWNDGRTDCCFADSDRLLT
jgi:hypothetical protein